MRRNFHNNNDFFDAIGECFLTAIMTIAVYAAVIGLVFVAPICTIIKSGTKGLHLENGDVISFDEAIAVIYDENSTTEGELENENPEIYP